MRVLIILVVSTFAVSCSGAKARDAYKVSRDVLVWARLSAATAVQNDKVRATMPHRLSVTKRTSPDALVHELFTQSTPVGTKADEPVARQQGSIDAGGAQ